MGLCFRFVDVVKLVSPYVFYCAYGGLCNLVCVCVCACVMWNVVLVRIGGFDVCLGLG